MVIFKIKLVNCVENIKKKKKKKRIKNNFLEMVKPVKQAALEPMVPLTKADNSKKSANASKSVTPTRVVEKKGNEAIQPRVSPRRTSHDARTAPAVDSEHAGLASPTKKSKSNNKDHETLQFNETEENAVDGPIVNGELAIMNAAITTEVVAENSLMRFDPTSIREAVNLHCLGEQLTAKSLEHIAETLSPLTLVEGFTTMEKFLDWKKSLQNQGVTKALEEAYFERRLVRDRCLSELVQECAVRDFFIRKGQRAPHLREESITAEMEVISRKHFIAANEILKSSSNAENEALGCAKVPHGFHEQHKATVAAESKDGLLRNLRGLRRSINEASNDLVNKALLFKVCFLNVQFQNRQS